ncbi:MAG: hypothetical protein GXP14_08535 [Gammaproteobacteria bacterium]|nr:hypothetical protein [Gammaproteobacteria bacterium]
MNSFNGSVLDNHLNGVPKEQLSKLLRYIDIAIRYWGKEDPTKAVFFIDAKYKCEGMIKKA